MNTNTREVKTRIRNYIINHIGEDYGAEEPKQAITNVYNAFKSEYGFNIKRYGEYNAFKEWLQGLPSALSVDFCHNEVNTIVEYWTYGNLTIKPRKTKYSDTETWNFFLHLITREFFAMLRVKTIIL